MMSHRIVTTQISHSHFMQRSSRVPAIRLGLAMALLAGTLLPGVPPAVSDQKNSPNKSGGSPGASTEEQKIVHLLNRVTYGPRPGDIERVQRLGLNAFLEEQLHPERIADEALKAKLARFESLTLSTQQITEKYPQAGQLAKRLGLKTKTPSGKPGASSDSENAPPSSNPNRRDAKKERQQLRDYMEKNGLKPPQTLLQDLQGQKLVRAVHSEQQLQEIMADFWMNHFNVFWGKGADKWLLTEYEQKVIRPHTLGKFEDILMATAKSPAMLFYLDNYLSTTPHPEIPDRIRRRTAKLPAGAANLAGPKRKPGINENYARELLELHTLGVDGGYTQKDVQEVARALTGWSIAKPGRRGAGGFVFRAVAHESGEKMVLGNKINAGGLMDGEAVIRLLAHHPSTAQFISTKLAQRFVCDNPSAALVDHATKSFQKSHGDIRAVLRALLSSPEFYGGAALRAKIKSPLETAASAIRALGGETDGSPALHRWVARMGEPLYLYQPPTGYPDRAEQWVNTGGILERLNFSLALAANRIPGTRVDLDALPHRGSVSPSPERTLDAWTAALLHGQASPNTRESLLKQALGSSGRDALDRVHLVGLILGSPDFQRQ